MSQYIKEEDGTWTKVGGMEKPLEEYSTTETVIGKWIDGRNIYRKVIDLRNASGQGVVPSNIPAPKDIQFIIKLDGYGNNSANNSSNGFTLGSISGNAGRAMFWNKESNNTITIQQSSTFYYFFIVIEYTKTTD